MPNDFETKAKTNKRLRNRKAFLTDETDAAILRELYEDARLSRAELARRVGLSAPSIGDRVQRLEEAGIITGYRAVIDPERLGLSLTVMIRARPLPGAMINMIEALRSTPQIVRCDRVSGEDCFVAIAHVRDVSEMEAVIDRIVPFGMTHSAIVQSAPFEPRMVELPQ